MLISAMAIDASKTRRDCAGCNSYIWKGDRCVRLFGAAEHGDPKSVIYLHRACARRDSCELADKTREARKIKRRCKTFLG